MKQKALTPIVKNIGQHVNSGTILLLSTIAALIVANSPLSKFYFDLFEDTYLSIDFHFWHLKKPLYYWINDGLMAIFFLLIGLEIKRELIIGELSSLQKALVPLVAAIGGMVVPALFYVGVNFANPDIIDGWAIPMATDIAFALGIMAILGKKVPIELKVLLTSLAIVDDLGAVLTIAIYYTDSIEMGYLVLSIVSWIGLFLLGRMGVRSLPVFILIGVLLVWYPMLKSGVHATVAGVMVAFTIPIRRKHDTGGFLKNIGESIERFRKGSEEKEGRLLNHEQYVAIEHIEDHCKDVTSPLQRLEHQLHTITLYGIMPLFAFANTGIDFSTVNFAEVSSSGLSVGIILGLFLGKVVGIVSFIYLFRGLKIIQLPQKLILNQYIGAGFLAGIGFTMSIFITDLAFHGADIADTAKMAILLASLLSGIVGFTILARSKQPEA
jgi:NhaA family Na+:H+ antiporter